jgi:cytochrome c oxidase subunit 1
MKKLVVILLGSLVGGTLPLAFFWLQHLFVTGLNPFLGIVFPLLLLLLSVFFVIRFLSWLRSPRFGNTRFTPALLFCIGCGSWLVSGFITEVYKGNMSLDVQLHDTYHTMSHGAYIENSYSGVVFPIAAFFAVMGGIYYVFASWIKRPLNYTLAYLHFWMTFVTTYLYFWPADLGNMGGMPRRYMDYSEWDSMDRFGDLNRFLLLVGVLLTIAQLLFVINVVVSLAGGRKTVNA